MRAKAAADYARRMAADRAAYFKKARAQSSARPSSKRSRRSWPPSDVAPRAPCRRCRRVGGDLRVSAGSTPWRADERGPARPAPLRPSTGRPRCRNRLSRLPGCSRGQRPCAARTAPTARPSVVRGGLVWAGDDVYQRAGHTMDPNARADGGPNADRTQHPPLRAGCPDGLPIRSSTSRGSTTSRFGTHPDGPRTTRRSLFPWRVERPSPSTERRSPSGTSSPAT